MCHDNVRLSLSKFEVKPEIKVSLTQLQGLKRHEDIHQHHTDFLKYGNQNNDPLKVLEQQLSSCKSTGDLCADDFNSIQAA